MPIRSTIPLALLTVALLVAGCSKSQPVDEEQTAKLIQPVAKVQLGAEQAAAGNTPRSGEQVATATCLSCHGSGVLGAPKLGDTAAWAPRIGLGLEGLLKSAIAGKNQMPARGGVADLSDEDLARAIAYMANKSGANFKEPALKSEGSAPQAAASTAAVDGKQVYDGACMACHASGVAGAPKLGDKALWAARIAQGKDTLYQHAIGGFNAMPAKGGNTALADAEVKAAVDYMVGASK